MWPSLGLVVSWRWETAVAALWACCRQAHRLAVKLLRLSVQRRGPGVGPRAAQQSPFPILRCQAHVPLALEALRR